MRGRVLSQVEVEQALQDEVEHLECLTNGGVSPKFPDGSPLQGYDDSCEQAATAEADWKIEEAKGLIAQANRAEEGKRAEPEYLRKARVLATKADLYRAYKIKGAAKEAHKEALTTSRTRVDALRTISANIRGQVGGS